MVSGRLTEKNGYFYIVLSYKGPDGKRVQKWQGTGLPVKGNKKKAEDLLRQARHSFTPPAPDRSTDLSPDMLFRPYRAVLRTHRHHAGRIESQPYPELLPS